MNIAEHIAQGCQLFPQRPALYFEGESFTYAQLDEMSDHLASGLADLGIAEGDRVALLLHNHPAFVTSYLGILKRGAIVVALNPALKTEEVTFMLNDCSARLVMTTAALRAQVNEARLPQLAHIVIVEGECPGETLNESLNQQSLANLIKQGSSIDHPVTRGIAEMQADAPAAILYTSGTTGFPKGAVLTHGNVVSNGHACIESFTLQPSDRVLLSLPLFHCFGQNAAMNPCFAAGATLVLQRQFEVEAVLRAINEQAITIFFGVPTLYLLLYEQATPTQFASVRHCISAAATLPVELAHKWQARYGLAINEGYGLTETCLNTFNHLVRYQPGSVGSPQTGIALRIVANEGQDAPLGELGEVAVQGPNVMQGYWNRPEETAQVLHDGWFYTGDIGRMDADGYFYIVDRVKDMVNVGGTKVYPSEVENVLYHHPAVAEAAVYGVFDELLGEQVAASLILRPTDSITDIDIRTFCRQHLADFKIPVLIEFVDTLPKGRTGKILKRMLRERFQNQQQQNQQQSASLLGPNLNGQCSAPLLTIPAIEGWLVDWVVRQFDLDEKAVATDRPLVEYGLTSALAVKLTRDLGGWLSRTVPPVLAWNFPTIAGMAGYLVAGQASDSKQMVEPAIEVWPTVEGFFVYDALLYDRLATDHQRNDAYQKAIAQSVPGKIVVEIGPGPTAILSRLCVAAGAKKVYAVEIGENAYQQARATIEKLGLTDRITLIHGDAMGVELPELADVCVSEIVGSIGGIRGASVILNRAWRWLKPGGRMIPQRSVTQIAAVTVPDAVVQAPTMPPMARHYMQKIFQQVGYPFDVRLCLNHFSTANLLSDSAIFEDLDFTQPTQTDETHPIRLTLQQTGRLDGFLLWLNLHTITGEVIDILTNQTSWLPIYLPVFTPGIIVKAGDRIEAVCRRAISDNHLNPDYWLTGQIIQTNGQRIEFHYASLHHASVFQQNSFYRSLFGQNGFTANPQGETAQLAKHQVPQIQTSTPTDDLEALTDAELETLLASEIRMAQQRKSK